MDGCALVDFLSTELNLWPSGARTREGTLVEVEPSEGASLTPLVSLSKLAKKNTKAKFIPTNYKGCRGIRISRLVLCASVCTFLCALCKFLFYCTSANCTNQASICAPQCWSLRAKNRQELVSEWLCTGLFKCVCEWWAERWSQVAKLHVIHSVYVL